MPNFDSVHENVANHILLQAMAQGICSNLLFKMSKKKPGFRVVVRYTGSFEKLSLSGCCMTLLQS